MLDILRQSNILTQINFDVIMRHSEPEYFAEILSTFEYCISQPKFNAALIYSKNKNIEKEMCVEVQNDWLLFFSKKTCKILSKEWFINKRHDSAHEQQQYDKQYGLLKL